MKNLIVGFAAVAALLCSRPAAAWMHGGGAHWSGNSSSWHAADGRGGTASGGDGSWNATGARGGTASGGDGSWNATGYRGGTASGGDGYWHGTGANGTTVYGGYNHYYGGVYSTYHPPTVVNVYGDGCYDCGGWNAAGAAAVGLAAGTAIGAASANAATQNAYAAGVAAGSAGNVYSMGAIVGTLPPACVDSPANGQTYYFCNGTWFKPSFGANGVYYRVVPVPS